jgi:transaldolase
MRNHSQLADLTGVDVFTMPVKVAARGRKDLSPLFHSNLDVIYPVAMTGDEAPCFIEKAWEVRPEEEALARDLSSDLPKNGDELVERAHRAGCGDLFPRLSAEELEWITGDGKIPVHSRWADRIASGELAIDTLLNLAGLASFSSDQAALDERIRNIIRS